MYPAKKDYQNAVLVKIYDEKNEHQIRTFWTQEPEMFLKMYTFIYENNIDIDIDPDKEDNDQYDNTIGTIKDIIFSTGGSYTYNIIKYIVIIIIINRCFGKIRISPYNTVFISLNFDINKRENLF